MTGTLPPPQRVDLTRPVLLARHWPDRVEVVTDLVPELLAHGQPCGWQRPWLLAARDPWHPLDIRPEVDLRAMTAVTYWTPDDQECTTVELDHVRAGRIWPLAEEFTFVDTPLDRRLT